MNLEDKYQTLCRTKSDINEHLPTLRKYAKKCEHVTEFGVREVVSTYAFLSAHPKVMRSYDVYKPSDSNYQEMMRLSSSVDFEFIQQNVLEIEIEQTDLLFIDTLHTYDQLIQELTKHGNKVNKYIILHDTTKFGKSNELHKKIINGKKIKTKYPVLNSDGKVGLKQAVDDFLKENNNWVIKEVFTNNNGLTVLEKK